MQQPPKKRYNEGDVVWAQAVDQPIWPSRIGKVIKDDLYRVYFLNDQHNALMRSAHLQAYWEHRQDNINADDTEKFRQAMKMADELVRVHHRQKIQRSVKPVHQKISSPRGGFRGGRRKLISKGERDHHHWKLPERSSSADQSDQSSEIVEIPTQVSTCQNTLREEHSQLIRLSHKMEVLARISAQEGEPTIQVIRQLQALRNKLTTLTEQMLLKRAIGSITDVLEVVMEDGRYGKSLGLIRGELVSMQKDLRMRSLTKLEEPSKPSPGPVETSQELHG